MPGMRGMAGMHGSNSAGGMAGMMAGDMPGMPMQTHLQMMRGAGADSMKAMLPMHRQMVANMLARMTGEMREMNMPADAAWSATVDSLRQDLVRMPEQSGADLRATMPGHMARVSRLADTHQRMMRQMAPMPK